MLRKDEFREKNISKLFTKTVNEAKMFSRVVSNFRRKSKANRKALKNSSSSSLDPKIDPSENRSGRKFSPEFDYDETFSATLLSVDDNECASRRNKSLSLDVDKSPDSSSGATNRLS